MRYEYRNKTKIKIISYWTDGMKSTHFRNKNVVSCNGFISIHSDVKHYDRLSWG